MGECSHHPRTCTARGAGHALARDHLWMSPPRPQAKSSSLSACQAKRVIILSLDVVVEVFQGQGSALPASRQCLPQEHR